MENALCARARRIDGARIGNVRLDDLKPRIALVLLQIAAPADNEIVEHANTTALVDQTIDKMASDEARTARDQVNQNVPADLYRSVLRIPGRTSNPTKDRTVVVVKRRVAKRKNPLFLVGSGHN